MSVLVQRVRTRRLKSGQWSARCYRGRMTINCRSGTELDALDMLCRTFERAMKCYLDRYRRLPNGGVAFFEKVEAPKARTA